jgi:hypothetical protein
MSLLQTTDALLSTPEYDPEQVGRLRKVVALGTWQSHSAGGDTPAPDGHSRPDELLFDCEEDRVLRAVLVGMLREGDRNTWGVTWVRR